MKSLVNWTPQVPAEKIVEQTKEILADADMETARRFEAAIKGYERSVQVLGLKNHMKALKQARIWTERKIGELLQNMEKAKGGRPSKLTGHSRGPVISTYAEIGITKQQASKFQKIAEVDEKTFQQVVEKTPSASAVLKAAAPETPPPDSDDDAPESVADADEPISMDPPLIESIKNLLQLVQKFKISEKTVLLYLCFCAYGATSPTQAEITGYTRLSSGTIRTHTKALEILGGIKREKQGLHTRVDVFEVKPPSPSTINLLLGTLDLRAQKEYAREHASDKYTSTSASTIGEDGFTVEDIEADDDYQKARAILDKYFKPFEINPVVLTKKKRFGKLLELISDETFNFNAFCKWYQREKCKTESFNFGLFLYPNVIEEFRYTYKREGRYLRTSPKESEVSESRKQGRKETKKFLENLLKEEKEEEK